MSPRPHVDVRPAGPADATVVWTMVRELAAHEGSLAAARTAPRRWAELLADDTVTVLVARIDGEPVGYVSAVRTLHLWSGRPVLALDDLYVRPGDRGHGVGEELMRALAASQPGHRIRWEVEEGNLAGQRFYVRLGAHLRRKVVAWWDAPAPG